MFLFLLPVPSIEEQRRIVAEYQTVEQRIQNNEQLIKKLEDTAQAIYNHTFVEGIDEENLPKGWRKGKLVEIAEFSNGKLIDLSTSGYPVYGGNDVVGLSPDYNAENVIIIGRVGVNCGCVYYNRDKCWVNDNAIKGTSNTNCILYLFNLLKSIELNRLSEGSSQPLLTQSILNNIDITIPSLQTIHEFEDKINIIQKYIEVKKLENSHLKSLLSLLTSKLS